MQTDKLARFPDWQTAMLADKLTRLPDCQTDKWSSWQKDPTCQTAMQTDKLTRFPDWQTVMLSNRQMDELTGQASRLTTKIVILTNWQACSVDWQTSMLSYKQTDRRPLTFSALTFSCTVNAFKSFNVTCSSWPIFYLPHTTRTYRTSMLICGQQCAQRWGTYTYTYIHDFQQYSTSAYGMSIRGQQYE